MNRTGFDHVGSSAYRHAKNWFQDFKVTEAAILAGDTKNLDPKMLCDMARLIRRSFIRMELDHEHGNTHTIQFARDLGWEWVGKHPT